MRAELKQFYRELLEWVEAEQPPHTTFEKDCGLCCQVMMWGENYYDNSTAEELHDEQRDMFLAAGLDKDFPFNTEESYNHEYYADAMYSNEARLNWIKEHAQ